MLKNTLKSRYVRVSFYIIFAILAFNFVIGTAFGANTITTDATLNGSSSSITISGRLDSFAECTNVGGQTPAGTKFMTMLAIPSLDDVGHTSFLSPDQVSLGEEFSHTFTTENLYDTGQIPYELETGVVAPLDIWEVSVMTLSAGNTDWATECMYLLGDWSGVVFSLLELPTTIEPFDFLGDTFTSTVVSSVTGGVQSTTQPLIPIAGTMLGVPLAFVIGRRVIGLIRLMV